MYSISFSVPRCNSPICGSTRSTTSPSSSSTSRSTPCAAGCCGPKLMVNLRSSPSRLPLSVSLVRVSMSDIMRRPCCAAFASLAAMPRLKRSQLTMKRSCVPAPISSTPSWARTLKRARGPLTSMHSASTVTVMPAGVADLCETSICTPRLPSPASRCGSRSCTQVHSISPTMKPVANTSGIAWSCGDFAIEMRDGLGLRDHIGEAVLQAGL